MKPLYKHSIASVCALALIAYLVYGLWMSRHAMDIPVCKQCQVRILDIDQRQYVNYTEIIHLLQSQGRYPVGKPFNRIALQPVEDAIRAHDMIRTAECYKSIDGTITIALTQRIPVVRVLTAAETYFVDSDHRIMPVRPSVTTPVLVATGEVSRRMAKEELSEFALWLQQDRYWRKYINQVQVLSPQMVHLKQIHGRADIVLGDWHEYEKKLRRLQQWYQADTLIQQEQYTTVDLRFHGQVIGIRNEPIR